MLSMGRYSVKRRRLLWLIAPVALSLACASGPAPPPQQYATAIAASGLVYTPICRRVGQTGSTWDCDSFARQCRGPDCEVIPRAQVPADILAEMHLPEPRWRWSTRQACVPVEDIEDCTTWIYVCAEPGEGGEPSCASESVENARTGRGPDWQAVEAVYAGPAIGAHGGGRGGPVHVRGYHRRDGTYVRPHTRSAPRRR